MTNDIIIKYSHKLPISEAKGKVELFLHDMKGQLGLEYSWIDDKTLQFKGISGFGKGVSGKLLLQDSSIVLEALLPMMLKPFKPMVEKQIKEKLAEKLSK